MTEDGCYSLRYMPFGKNAVVELINEDQKPREVAFEITHAPLDRPLKDSAIFTASGIAIRSNYRRIAGRTG